MNNLAIATLKLAIGKSVRVLLTIAAMFQGFIVLACLEGKSYCLGLGLGLETCCLGLVLDLEG